MIHMLLTAGESVPNNRRYTENVMTLVLGEAKIPERPILLNRVSGI